MWNRNFIMVVAGQIISLFGNAVIPLINSFAGMIGPVIGGALFGLYGIMPILYVCLFCFLLSAIMEIFIQIPFEKKAPEGNIFAIAFGDLKESLRYMCREQPVIVQLSLAAAAINLILSALVMIGQAIYGGLFEVLGKRIFLLFFAAMLLTGMLALLLKRIFQKLEALLE